MAESATETGALEYFNGRLGLMFIGLLLLWPVYRHCNPLSIFGLVDVFSTFGFDALLCGSQLEHGRVGHGVLVGNAYLQIMEMDRNH